MSSKRAPIFWAIGLAILLAALFLYPRLVQKIDSYTGSVSCLSPNVSLLTHIHPHLTVSVDGIDETIPANLRLGGSCERAIHMHDATGEIHVESQVIRDYILDDFAGLWGQPIQRDGYNLVMTVDGKPSQEFGNLILKDLQEIVLKYTKK